MSFASFDGSVKKKYSISLRGNSKKEDKATLIKKARENRQARLKARAQKEAALPNDHELKFAEVFDLVNRAKFILSANPTNLSYWARVCALLLRPMANSYGNPPPELKFACATQQQTLFCYGIVLMYHFPLSELFPEQVIKLLRYLFTNIAANNSFEKIAAEPLLALTLSRWVGVDQGISKFWFSVIVACLDGAETNRIILSKRFVQYFVMDIQKKMVVMSEDLVEFLLQIIPKLSGFSDFLTGEMDDNSVAVIQILFDLALKRPEILSFVLEGFNIQSINTLIRKEKTEMEISDEENW
eukprot:CAMPEP_0117002012 /NCGR_PEP_ID=MMETSP0472-20121206/3821_1 /TAXON_ID=693140 ORGANISM="Tiarina fusus, Strain LIS" /NCGR_SAMPLE_ID=MMETSP0472 /ASSEMBLY_ACC=CAM_ASM_000603 /LENGTH=298 /DNA_ID=CAMNT_0004702213 /DNA_START=34 /DNA_END=927 /DNA_ORIENTATION=-